MAGRLWATEGRPQNFLKDAPKKTTIDVRVLPRSSKDEIVGEKGRGLQDKAHCPGNRGKGKQGTAEITCQKIRPAKKRDQDHLGRTIKDEIDSDLTVLPLNRSRNSFKVKLEPSHPDIRHLLKKKSCVRLLARSSHSLSHLFFGLIHSTASIASVTSLVPFERISRNQ